MTKEQKITRVQTLLDGDAEATTQLVSVYLDEAEQDILHRLYPFGVPACVFSMPQEYGVLQCDLAVRYFLRRGAEGEISHSSNGTERTYGSVNDEDLLSVITPYAKVVR